MKLDYVTALLQRQWASHCAYPNSVVVTIFKTRKGCCQLVSNTKDNLLLNISFEDSDGSMENELENRFRNNPLYAYFAGGEGIYELEFGGVTQMAVQITSAILREVFGISTDREIETSFEDWVP